MSAKFKFERTEQNKQKARRKCPGLKVPETPPDLLIPIPNIAAPTLFLGATLGSLYGHLLHGLVDGAGLPIAIADEQSFALVGMASVLAASCRVPLTSTLLLFELTRDYSIVLPTLGGVALSFLFASNENEDRAGGGGGPAAASKAMGEGEEEGEGERLKAVGSPLDAPEMLATVQELRGENQRLSRENRMLREALEAARWDTQRAKEDLEERVREDGE